MYLFYKQTMTKFNIFESPCFQYSNKKIKGENVTKWTQFKSNFFIISKTLRLAVICHCTSQKISLLLPKINKVQKLADL